MTETTKLRALVDEFERYRAARDWLRSPEELLPLISAQAVLALEEQLAAYRSTVRGTRVVQCKACHGTGRGSGYATSSPCKGCGGSGMARV